MTRTFLRQWRGSGALFLALALVSSSCAGPGGSGKTDAGVADSGEVDTDAGELDAGPVDDGGVVTDAGPNDAGTVDGGRPDAGPSDGGVLSVISVAITPNAPSVLLGGTQQLAAQATYSDNTTRTVTAEASWVSSDTRIADVSGGLVTSHALGTMTVTARFSGVSGTAQVAIVPVPITSITLSPLNTSVALGRTQRVIATARYQDGHTSDVSSSATWSSDLETVATVATGTVTTRAEGVAHITAEKDGITSGPATITVTAPTPVSLAVTPQNGSVPKGGTLALTAKATLTNNTTQDVTTAATWTSSAPAIVEVTTDGHAIGHVQSFATITAELGTLSATTTIAVAPPALTSLTITPSTPSFALGDNVQLHADGHYSDGTDADVTNRVSWSSSNDSIAMVTQVGLVLGRVAGTVTITASSGGVSTSVPLTVQPPALISITVTNPGAVSFPLGLDLQLGAKGTYSDGSTADISGAVTWSSGATQVAEVSASGLVTGVSVGSAPISASLDGKTGTTSITVAQHALVSIAVLPSAPQMPLGTKQDFTVTATFTDQATGDVTANATWVSLNPAAATVTVTGNVVARALGASTIRATYGGLTASSVVTVIPAVLARIVVSPSTATLKPGVTQQFTAQGIKTDGSPQTFTNDLVWSSSDDTLATVSSTGLGTAVDTGTVTIRATAQGITGSATLTVLPRLVSIALTPDSPGFPLGLNQQLTATGTFLDDHKEDLTSTATWTSSDPNVATVSSTGLVQSVSIGTAIITAKQGVIQGSTTITVQPAALVGFAISPTQASIPLGLGTSFTVTGTYTDRTTRNLTSEATWVSSNEGVATVSSGSVQSVAQGPATITASVPGFTASATLTVLAPELVSIAVTPVTSELPWGRTVQLTATGTYTDDSTADLTNTASWLSSNATIALPSATGLVSTGGIGAVTITATVGTVSGSADVTVDAAVLVSIAISPPSMTVPLGIHVSLTATGTYTNGTTNNLTAAVTWSSEDPTTAAVGADGDVSTLLQGTTTITAELGEFSSTATVTATPPQLTSITLSPTSARMALGLTQQMTATGHYTDQSTQGLTSQVTWTMDDTGIATASTDGLITSAGVGTTFLTAALGSVRVRTDVTIDPALLLSVTLSPENVDVPKGTPVVLTATGHYTDNTAVNLTSSATWTSSNEAVVSFAAPGQAQTLSVGQADVTATLGEFTVSTSITVEFQALTKIEITPANSHIAKGYSENLTATGTYTDASIQDLTTSVAWVSSNTGVAEIDSTGNVTSVDVGTTNITATWGSIVGTTSLTVDAHALVFLAISPTHQSTPKGTPVQLSVTGTYSDAATADLTSSAVWSSSNTGIATVSAGRVLSVGEGSANITAKVGTVSDTTDVTVLPHALVSIAVTPATSTLPLGNTTTLTATGTYTDTLTANLTATATWTSSDETVATVSAGNVQTRGQGPATLTATVNGISGSSSLTVGAPQLLTLTVAPASQSLAKGLTSQLTATGHYTDSVDRDLTATATWTTSSSTLASVSSSGLVTAKAVGTATITAKSGTIQGTATVVVGQAELVSIAVDAVAPIPLGSTSALKATGTYTDATTLDITSSVTWSSSDTSKVTIVGTSAKGVGIGSATVTATKGAISNSTTVTIGAAVIASIAVTPTNRSLVYGDTLQLTATGTKTDGTTVDITTSVTWSFDQPDTWASLTSTGFLTAKNPGSENGTLTVKATSGSVSGTVKITIQALWQVVIGPANPSVVLGQTLQLSATAYYLDGTTTTMRDVTNLAEWREGFTEGGITRIDNSPGLVRAIAPHDGDVIAIYNDVDSANTTIRVTGPTSLVISTTRLGTTPVGTAAAPITISQGNSIQLYATGTFTGGVHRDLTAYVDWSTTNVNAIPVYQGYVTGNQPAVNDGSAQYYVSAGAGGAASAQCYINVGPPVGGPSRTSSLVAPTITISGTENTLYTGSAAQLTATAHYANGSVADVTSYVTWASDNSAVAVSSTGLLSTYTPGSAHITASFSTGGSGSVDVEVLADSLLSISLSESALQPASGLQLVAIGSYASGAAEDVTDQAFWTSSDATVATVTSTGLTTGVSSGTVTISARVGSVSGSLSVTQQ